MLGEIGEPFWRGWQGWAVFLSRLSWSALVWWVLSAGAAESWLVGVPAVLGAALLSSCMLPPLRVSFRGAVRFTGFFLLASLRGGLDVARRALHWRLPLDPGFLEHRGRALPPVARVFVANTSSLLPGTLTADVDDRRLYVHALDTGSTARATLERAERHIADLFSLDLRDQAGGQDPGRAP